MISSLELLGHHLPPPPLSSSFSSNHSCLPLYRPWSPKQDIQKNLNSILQELQKRYFLSKA